MEFDADGAIEYAQKNRLPSLEWLVEKRGALEKLAGELGGTVIFNVEERRGEEKNTHVVYLEITGIRLNGTKYKDVVAKRTPFELDRRTRVV